MSNDIQKADQIAYRFYSKLCLVVSNARSTAEPRSQSKVDKWFNLETPDSDLLKEPLRIYRTISSSPSPPAFELQVLLSVPELSSNQVLVHLAPDSSRLRIDPTPQHIVLETWTLNFIPSLSNTHEHPGDVAPSTIYKHGIPLFRSLYSLLRILPSWKLYRRLRRRIGSPYRTGNMTIQLRIKGVDDGFGHVLSFENPPALNAPLLPYETYPFPPVPHPMGTLSVCAKYLTSPNFQLDELESLLSSRFLSLDEGSDFTPTLAKNQVRESLFSLGAPSGSLRTNQSKSPPSSVAGQFILPPPGHPGVHLRSNSMSGGHSPRAGHAALPMSRTSTSAAGAGSTSALSVTSSRQDSSGTWSKEEGALPSVARIRRESTSTTGRSLMDLPSAPGPLPIRRPGISPVHPFRSSTLSSGSPSLHSPSPSLRQPSPLSTGGTLPMVPCLPSRPTQTSPTSSRVPPSPIGMGSRPSPPFAPSSLGDRRSLASAEGVEGSSTSAGDGTSVKLPTRKRYSSSFGHRYATSASGGVGGSGGAGTGSEASPGSGRGAVASTSAGDPEREQSQERQKEQERERTTSFLGMGTDDDELSIFVQEIDARKPLAGTTGRPSVHGRALTIITSSSSPSASAAGIADLPLVHAGRHSGEGGRLGITLGGAGATTGGAADSHRSSSIGPVLTREAEVDEELKRMHEVFLASLEGLGSGTSRRRSEANSGTNSRRGEDSQEGGSVGGLASSGGRVDYGSVEPSSGRARQRPGSLRSLTGGDVASSGGSAEVIGRLELDEDTRRRG